jgi:hypothetical protein
LSSIVRAVSREILRVAALAGFLAVALSAPAHAACNGRCEPSDEDGRAAMQQIFKQTFLSPYTLVSFEKLDGRSGERYGGVFYEMRIRAVLHYEGIRLRCRRPSCPELHHYLMENDAAGKKVTVAGWLFLEQDGNGWKTVPLTPGPQ